MVSIIDQNSYETEKNLLREVFEQQDRGGQAVWVYNYDQRYYRVLSACAKLRLKTKNLPEGNPTYIEVKDPDWQQVVVNGDSGAAPAQPAAEPAPKQQDAYVAPTPPDPSEISIIPPMQPNDMPEGAPADIAPQTTSENNPAQVVRSPEQNSNFQGFIKTQPSAVPPSYQSVKPAPAPRMPIDPAENIRVAEEARMQSDKAREISLKTREDAIRVREHSVREREKSVKVSDQELRITEEALGEQEQRQDVLSNKLDKLQNRLNVEAEKLTAQKDEVMKLSDHLAKVARNLMVEEI